MVAGYATAQEQCPPPPWTASSLQQLKAAQWKLANQQSIAALAQALVPCLAHPDPHLRDGLAFEALSTWLRAKALDAATQRQLMNRLLHQLQEPDAQGFSQPFTALALAEVARADRVEPFLTVSERDELQVAAQRYLRGISDYRGWVDGQGWRHGVAHAADWMMQLALNPALDAAQLAQIARAVQVQIAPPSGHTYVFGESERLARPIVFVARRSLLPNDGWQSWVRELVALPAGQTWGSASQTSLGLAKLHNTKAFLLALYWQVQENHPEPLRSALLEPVRQALRTLP